MTVSMSFINGISVGIEYVAPMPDDGIENACVLIDLAFFRVVLEIL